jgi:hypothetical protein
MTVKKYLHPKKEKKVDHTSHREQDEKGSRHVKRHVFQNYPNDVCREQNQHKHHLCKKQEEDQSPSIDYIVFAMSSSLDDQTTHAKVCSSHRYEKQKLMEKMMTQSCQICTTW